MRTWLSGGVRSASGQQACLAEFRTDNDKVVEVNSVIGTLRVLFGARGVMERFNHVLMISNAAGASLVVQCISRNRGRSFSAEFAIYSSVGRGNDLDVDVWHTEPIVAPVSLFMLFECIEDRTLFSAHVGVRKVSSDRFRLGFQEALWEFLSQCLHPRGSFVVLLHTGVLVFIMILLDLDVGREAVGTQDDILPIPLLMTEDDLAALLVKARGPWTWRKAQLDLSASGLLNHVHVIAFEEPLDIEAVRLRSLEGARSSRAMKLLRRAELSVYKKPKAKGRRRKAEPTIRVRAHRKDVEVAWGSRTCTRRHCTECSRLWVNLCP